MIGGMYQRCLKRRSRPVAPGQAEPVEDEPGEHHRGRGADVADGEDEDEDADAGLGREHDREHQGHPRDRLRAVGPALGEQHGDRDHGGVGDRRRDVGRVQVQAEHPDEKRDLRQFGGDERHVGDVPAGQVHVAVQHVVGHQQDVGLVRVLRVGLGQVQVRVEEHDDDQQEDGRARPPPGPAGRPGAQKSRALRRPRRRPPAGPLPALGSALPRAAVPERQRDHLRHIAFTLLLDQSRTGRNPA